MADTPLRDMIRDKRRQLTEAEALVLRLKSELDGAKEELLGVPKPLSARLPSSSTDMAEAILTQARGDMHIHQILAAIQQEFHVRVKYATLVTNLSRMVKKKKIFERTGPNRFGLLEWADTREAEELFSREQMEREVNEM